MDWRSEKQDENMITLTEGSQALIIRYVDNGCFTLSIIDSSKFENIGLDKVQAQALINFMLEEMEA